MEAIIYLAIGAYLFYHEFTRPKKAAIDFQRMFLAFFFLYYVLPGILIGGLRMFNVEIDNRYPVFDEENLEAPLAILLFLVSSIAGFSTNLSNRVSWAPIVVRQQSQMLHTYILCGFICIGLAGFWLTSIPFGGPIGLIRSAWTLRHTINPEGGADDAGGGIYLGIGNRLMPITVIAFNIAFSMFLYSRGGLQRTSVLLVFGFSIAVSLLTIAGQMSRGLVITTMLYPLILYCNYRGKINTQLFLVGIPAALFFILFGKPIFASIAAAFEGREAFISTYTTHSAEVQLASAFDAFVEIMQNFTHRIASTIVAIREFGGNPDQIRGIADILNVPFSWIAPFVGQEKPESVTDLNTILMLGSLHKFVPPGVVAYSFYSFWWLGPLLYGYAYGYIANLVEEIHLRNWDRHFWVPGFYSFFAMYFGFGWLGFEPRTVANGLFSLGPVLFAFRFLLVRVKRSSEVQASDEVLVEGEDEQHEPSPA